MHISAAYDEIIAQAAERFLPEWGPLWLKAELLAESELDPKAVSPAGAQGIAQIMPGTWPDLARTLKFPANATAFDPQYAIPAAALYLSQMRRVWWMPRPEEDRRRLAQASYNAGRGNLINAQRAADNATDYATIIAALPRITGDANAAETRHYVENIERWHARLLAETNP